MASVRTKKPTQPRLRNPLNVVVDRVSATRAMVQGDVSVESLRELLMSSLSVLPEANASSTPKDAKIGDKDEANLEPVEKKRVDEEKVPGSLANEQIGKDSGRKRAEDGLSDKKEKGRRVEDKKRKLKKSKKSKIDEEASKSRSRGKKRGRGGSEPSSSSSSGDLEEEEEEEVEEESLPSCPTISGPEESLLSHDAQWLRVHFGTALTQGLKQVVARNPEDPVSWLAFFLRRYRSLEEERARKARFESDLRACRSVLASRINADETNKVESLRELDEENFGEEGEGDTNFQNYNPVSKEDDKDVEEET